MTCTLGICGYNVIMLREDDKKLNEVKEMDKASPGVSSPFCIKLDKSPCVGAKKGAFN